MKQHFLILLFFLNAFAGHPLQISEFSSRYYFTPIKGLSHNNVKAIVQDHDGFIWIGTRNGLNRYDGYEVKMYNCHDETTGAGNNNISSLFEDRDRDLWIGTDRGIFIYNSKNDSFSQFTVATPNGVVIQDWIAQIKQDNENNIWIIVPNQGVFRYNKESHELKQFLLSSINSHTYKHPQCLAILKSGDIWVGTNKDGIYLYNAQSQSFEQHITDRNGVSIKDELIYCICEYNDFIILGIHEGKLKKYDRKTNTFSVVNCPDVHYSIIRDLQVFNQELWVGTEQGIFVINEEQGYFKNIRYNPMSQNSLPDNKVYSMYQDREGGIWIGSRFEGACYIPTQTIEMERYEPNMSPHSICGRVIRDMAEDESGNIWICTEDNGIALFNQKQETFRQIIPSGGIQRIPQGIVIDQDRVWVGLFKNGIDIYDSKTLNVQHLSQEELGIDESSIWAMHLDKKGRIWIGNGWGVYSSSRDKIHFQRHNEFGSVFVHDIYEDSKGYIWVCTLGSGVFKLNPMNQALEHYTESNKPGSLSSNSVSSITEDEKGNLWFSTDRGGLCKYDEATNSFRHWRKQDGLPDDMVYKIVEDNDGNLWFGTEHGLVRFNPQTEDIYTFTEKDGLLNNQFNYKSAIKTRSGKLFFGSTRGLIAISPNKTHENKITPVVCITKLKIFNQEINIDTDNSPLQSNITHTDKIVLNHDQNSISLNFSALLFSSSGTKRYRYKLDNFDKDWIICTDHPNASYTNLSPGTYTFLVSTTDSFGNWLENSTALEIVIKAPWWRSNIANTIYVLLVCCGFVIFIVLYNRKLKNHYEKQQILYEKEHEKELYNAKIEFFTAIAHEIRTPCILINGPLENILESEESPDVIKKNLPIIEQNVKRLLNLIDQLLDFRKVDENRFILNFRNTNLNQLLNNTIYRFDPMIEQMGKKIVVEICKDNLVAYIDPEAFTKIISNLLNNAMKYSEKYIRVELVEQDEIAVIRVINDGTPIPPELSKKVFEPFFRTTKDSKISGSGIGLSLAQKLATLNHAELTLDGTAPLTTFCLSVPIKTHATDVYEPETGPEKEKQIQPIIDDEPTVKTASTLTVSKDTAEPASQKEYTILVVEDDPDVILFLSEQLRQYFNVYTAENGKEALKILGQVYIDIILSDMVMPEMGGLELCKTVKSQEDLAQIPVVMLTAKTDMDSKLESLEMGADAYIEKPVSFKYLHKHLLMLLKNREKEKKAFLNKPFFPIQKMKVNKNDEKFLEKVIGIIESNITNPDLNVQFLADNMCISRSSLHRKVTQTTTLSPVEFIKLIRLKKAAALIQESEYQIAEICFMVGINSPSYFSKMFFNQFGITPKEFSKNSRAEKNKNI